MLYGKKWYRTFSRLFLFLYSLVAVSQVSCTIDPHAPHLGFPSSDQPSAHQLRFVWYDIIADEDDSAAGGDQGSGETILLRKKRAVLRARLALDPDVEVSEVLSCADPEVRPRPSTGYCIAAQHPHAWAENPYAYSGIAPPFFSL